MLAALWQVRAPCSVGGRHPPIPAGTRMQPDKAMRGFVRGFFESIPKLQACRPNKPKGERPAVHPFRRGMTVGCVLVDRSEEHTSELQSLMRISYAVFCLKKKTTKTAIHSTMHK